MFARAKNIRIAQIHWKYTEYRESKHMDDKKIYFVIIKLLFIGEKIHRLQYFLNRSVGIFAYVKYTRKQKKKGKKSCERMKKKCSDTCIFPPMIWTLWLL